jgi:hypothetical protein
MGGSTRQKPSSETYLQSELIGPKRLFEIPLKLMEIHVSISDDLGYWSWRGSTLLRRLGLIHLVLGIARGVLQSLWLILGGIGAFLVSVKS